VLLLVTAMALFSQVKQRESGSDGQNRPGLGGMVGSSQERQDVVPSALEAGHESELDPDEVTRNLPSAQVYRVEVQVRADLLELIDRAGAREAYRMALQWCGQEGQSLRRRLEMLVALRALPGLALASKDPELLKESEALLLGVLVDGRRPRADRNEALAALFGLPTCYGIRGAKSLARIPGSDWSTAAYEFYPNVKMNCCNHHRETPDAPPCPDNVLNSHGVYPSLTISSRTVAVLEGIARAPVQEHTKTLAIASLVALARVHDARGAQVVRDLLEQADVNLVERSIFFEVMANAVLNYSAPTSRSFEAVLEVARSGRVPQVRAQLIKALDFSPIQARPEAVQIVCENAGSLRSTALQNPDGAQKLAMAVIGGFEWLWNERGLYSKEFDSPESFDQMVGLAASMRADFEEAVEAVATMPGEELLEEEEWKALIRELYEPLVVDHVTIGEQRHELSILPPYPSQLMLQILRKHPESPRAQRLLRMISEAKAHE
jgi:hypothetical protein